MPVLEEVKRSVERWTGIGRPTAGALADLTRPRKPNTYFFKDDGQTPNNPRLPLVHYRTPVRLRGYDPAAIFEELFSANGWADSWRDSVYDFLHFHTGTHEVLGIARGRALIQFGGARGRKLVLDAGDVVVLPAGTGHRRLSKSHDLLVVGAYPAAGCYDEPRPEDIDHDAAIDSIAHVRIPKSDPVYGKLGPLLRCWR